MSKKMYSFRFDSEVIDEAKELAKSKEMSFNSYVVKLIKKDINDYKKFLEEKEKEESQEKLAYLNRLNEIDKIEKERFKNAPDNWVEIDVIVEKYNVEEVFVREKMKSKGIDWEERFGSSRVFNVKNLDIKDILGI